MSADTDRSRTCLCLGGLSGYILRVSSVADRLQGAKHSTLKEADSTNEVNITHIVHSADITENAVFTGEIALRGFDQFTRSGLSKELLSHGIFCNSACVHESSRFDSSARTVLTASAKTGAAAWPHSRRMYVKESAIWASSRASAKAGMFSS